MSSHGLSPVHMGGREKEISLFFSSYKDTSDLLEPYPTLMTSLTIIISLNALPPNTVTLRVKASTYEFFRGTVQSITIPNLFDEVGTEGYWSQCAQANKNQL